MTENNRAESRAHGYGRFAILLHWTSAGLILAMLPLGFLMQDASGDSKLALYRIHAAVGVLVLLLTLVRAGWKVLDTKPAPPPGLTGLHLRGMEAIHILLYALLFLLTVSGIILTIQSGLVDILSGASQGRSLPDFDAFQSRSAHGVLARIYIALLAAHIGGVLLHQLRYGHVLSRMGIGRADTANPAGQAGPS